MIIIEIAQIIGLRNRRAVASDWASFRHHLIGYGSQLIGTASEVSKEVIKSHRSAYNGYKSTWLWADHLIS